MASEIKAGNATSGVGISSDSTGILEIKTGTGAGTTAVTVDASQNVGVGTSSPGVLLDLYKAAGPTLKLGASGGNLQVAHDGSTGTYYVNSGALPHIWQSNSAERMRINAGAPILCLSGGNTSATGTGIAFPATQSASTDANTLDDYEEGTFTPTVIGTTVAGTATYSVQVGRYTKIGNRVLFEARVTYTGGNGTGNLRMTGLPFTSNTNSQSSLAANYGNLALTANNVAQCYVLGNSTSISIEQYPVGGGAATDVAYDAAATILVAGQYEVA